MAVDEAEVRHFLGRVGFAPSQDDVAHFAGREIADIVDEVVDAAATGPAEPAWVATEARYLADLKTVEWWLNRMRVSQWAGRSPTDPSPLIEKLTLFWHGHFATASQKVENAELMFEQNQLYRNGGLGDFEQLCQQVSLHGAMLIYLDNDSNVSGGVQENFARELMELFTMGVGNYTEADVVAMARAWTGHGIVGWIPAEQRTDGTYEFHADLHDSEPKTIFGIEANWDGPDTITEICQGARQQATANFIATKLWRFFVNGAPQAAAIGQLAAVFINSGMNIKELVRALLNHPDFWHITNRRTLIKTPTQYVVDFNRCTGLTFAGESASWQMRPMGQELFAPPNVSGWGSNGYWLSTATMWGRAQYATDLRWTATNETGFLSELALMNTEVGVDRLLEIFRIGTPSPATRTALTNWFDATKNGNDWALAPVGVSVAALTPEFQVI